jgi:FAD/FMN-containing dehydrogenase
MEQSMKDMSLPPSGKGLGEPSVRALSAGLRGGLLQPGDDGYDTARTVWNAMTDNRPAVIARCAGAADVIHCVRFAREHELLVSVRGGGHNVAGNAVCEGGLMIDLSPMKSVRVDAVTRTARAEPGVLWGEFDRETQAFGLATTGGQVSTTGIAGLTLGGGEGWLASKYGYAVDNLLSADVVTADGRLTTASATANEDLFWALRGAGHNFGVVTSFEYRLHPLSTVLGGMVLHPFERARDVLRFYREFGTNLPDELTTIAGILTGPDGDLVVALVACYAGPLDEGERVLAPLRRFGPPVADTIAPISYTVMQTLFDAALPPGRLNYWKASLMSQLSDEVIEAIVEHARRIPSPFSGVFIPHYHGAFSRVGKRDTAYYHRDLQYELLILSSWIDPVDSEANISWTRELFQAVQTQVRGAVYVNMLDRDEGELRVQEAYGMNYERLVALKNKYDPTNFFRLNQNIRPDAIGV